MPASTPTTSPTQVPTPAKAAPVPGATLPIPKPPVMAKPLPAPATPAPVGTGNVPSTLPKPVAPPTAPVGGGMPAAKPLVAPPAGAVAPAVAPSATPAASPPAAAVPAPVKPPTAPVPGAVVPGLPPAPPKPMVPPAPGAPPQPLVNAPAKAPLPPMTPAGGGAGSPPKPPTSGSPQLAGVKKSPLRFVPYVVGALIVLILGFVGFSFFTGGSDSTSTTTTTPPTSNTTTTAKKTTVTYWGLWEPTSVMNEVIEEFEKANPDVNVDYIMQSSKEYRERLQTAVASGNGPDIFRFHASWVPMLKSELSPMPSSVMTSSEFQSTFYPVMSKQLQVGTQTVGVPTGYDGLALYYNKDILAAANVQPPTTWAELRTLAMALTIRNGSTIERGGLAIGNATNVDHFSDIIGLLMLQNGANPAQPTSTEAKDALTFYTNFVKVDRVWSPDLPNSTVAFARGDVAMMFAPSWRAHEIKNQNPALEFGIAPVPQLGQDKIAWASYWAEGVSAQSKNKDAAWKFVKYLSTAEAQRTLHSAQSEVRPFGTVYSRVDMAPTLSNHPYLAAYVEDAPQAQGWYLNSATHDSGLNDQLIKYYLDAVTAVLTGKNVTEALSTVSQGTSQVLRQYGVSSTSTSTSGAANPAGAVDASAR